jgi:subtilase family serine protease
VSLLAASSLVAGALIAPTATSMADEVPGSTMVWPSDEASFTVVLPYDSAKLRRLARKIATPDAGRYRQFLTLEEAAQKVGTTRQARRDLRERAGELGLTVSFDPTGLTGALRGPRETWAEIYGEEFLEIEAYPKAVSTYIPDSDDTNNYAPSVPIALRGVVQKVFPIDTVVDPAQVSAAVTQAMDQPANEGTPFGPGEDCILEQNRPYTYSPNQLHVPYGTTALHEQGIRGENARMAIIGVGEMFNPGYAEIAGECFDYDVARLDVVGGPGIGDQPVVPEQPAGIESNLDVQVTTAVLPDAPAVLFVETVSSVSFTQNLLQGYTTALQNSPDVITLSYGECVSGMQQGGDWQPRRYLDDLFAFSAIVGTSILIAAGDSGSSGCLHGGGDDPAMQAGFPATSPWATAVGGSRIILGADNERVNEVVWNSTTWDPGLLGAGGGSPTPYRSPWYQARLTSQDRRLVPDVVAHAAVSPGWPVVISPEQYEAFFGTSLPPGATWGIAPVGGTSAASPFTAANMALIMSETGRLGFLNPLLYALAEQDLDAAFFDIVEGNNMVVPEPACCPAIKGYDMASGLGAPRFDALLELIGGSATR